MIIKRWIKYVVALLLHYSGINSLLMRFSRRHYILMFHRLEEKKDLLNISIPVHYLGAVVNWTQEIGNIQTMDDMIQAKNKAVRFCITFDDGFSNVKRINEVAAGVPYILYLATAYIQSSRLFWAVQLEQLICSCDCEGVDLTSFNLGYYDLSNNINKERAISTLNSEIKEFHPADVEAIIKYLQLSIKRDVDYGYVEKNDFLNWSEVRSLMNSGMEVGGHTHSHVISSKVSPDEFKDEIQLSNKLISENLAIDCKHFAYPNGRQQDISVFSRKILIAEGYRSAVTTIEGPNNVGDDPYLLKRFNVSKNRISSPWGTPSKAMFTTMLVNPLRSH
jgi:peptidoglycan/xylan/chitin deacetylase (PgdA/CDA1 family)